MRSIRPLNPDRSSREPAIEVPVTFIESVGFAVELEKESFESAERLRKLLADPHFAPDTEAPPTGRNSRN
jgi:hypothetical protein